MSTDTLFAVLGVVATVVFGLLSLGVWRARKYPGEITFLRRAFIRIFDAVVDRLPDVKVLYQGQPVDERLVLVQGYIINSGHKDLSRDMVAEPLSATLPEGAAWLEVKALSDSKVNASATLKDESTAEFSFDLLRCGEFIDLSGLVRVASHPEGDQAPDRYLHRRMSFAHRILDTSSVKVLDHTRGPALRNVAGRFLLAFAALAGLVAVTALTPPRLELAPSYTLSLDHGEVPVRVADPYVVPDHLVLLSLDDSRPRAHVLSRDRARAQLRVDFERSPVRYRGLSWVWIVAIAIGGPVILTLPFLTSALEVRRYPPALRQFE